jgi:hypothetical protein
MSRSKDDDKLLTDIKSMSDNQLVDRAAQYNANLRRGRKLVAEGKAMIDGTIDLFVICQNELHSRTHRRVEDETDREMKS